MPSSEQQKKDAEVLAYSEPSVKDAVSAYDEMKKHLSREINEFEIKAAKRRSPQESNTLSIAIVRAQIVENDKETDPVKKLENLIRIITRHNVVIKDHHKTKFFSSITSSELSKCYEKVLGGIPAKMHNWAKDIMSLEQRSLPHESRPFAERVKHKP